MQYLFFMMIFWWIVAFADSSFQIWNQVEMIKHVKICIYKHLQRKLNRWSSLMTTYGRNLTGVQNPCKNPRGSSWNSTFTLEASVWWAACLTCRETMPMPKPYLCRLTSSSGTWLKRTTTPRTSPSGCAPTSGWVESSSRRYYTPAAASSPTTADNQMPAVENAFRDFWSPFLDSLTNAEMEKMISN